MNASLRSTSDRATQGHAHPPANDNTTDDHQTNPTSPRNAILSQNALQQQLSTDRRSSTVESRNAERKRDGHSRSHRDRRKRTSQQGDLSLMSLSRHDHPRSDSRSESVQMRDLLESSLHQVQLRAAELQRINDETIARVRVLNENQLAAQQEAAKANTELKLTQFQLESAQKEIEKTKAALKEVEKQRDEAETAAARAREKARKYQQERLVAAAREEGRKRGFEAGLNHAKKEHEVLVARRGRRTYQQSSPPPRPPTRPPPPTRKDKGKEREYYPDDQPRRPPHRKHTRDDIQSSPDMSPPLPVDDLPSMRAGPSRRPPTRMHRSRPKYEEHDDDEEENGYEPEDEEPTSAPAPPPAPPPPRPPQQQRQQQQPQEYPRTKTPSVYNWKINIPSADKLNESFNSTEHPDDAIRQAPRNEWVTASKHQEIRKPYVDKRPRDSQVTTSQSQPPTRPTEQVVQNSQSPLPNLPTSGLVPAPIVILPPRQEPGPPPKPASAIKSVKFWARRPSLAKTKQQATSWYRSLSFRKKGKPVIDPIAEEFTDTPPASMGPNAMDSELQVPDSADYPPLPPGALYGPRPQTSQSWYQKRASVGPSVRSYDYAFARRQPSDLASVSTRVSQFDLLATPAQMANGNVMMGTGSAVGATRNKGKGRMVEKDSQLSMIKEDTASRGTTPARSFGYGPGGSESMQQDFGQRRELQQRTSYDSFNGSVQDKRRGHRPPAIAVPDPNALLQPPGVAYQQGGYIAGTDLLRQPSIKIDVVPPSGAAPDASLSPPHTGRNHLSPYHVFQPGDSIRDRILDPPKTPIRPNSMAHGRAASAGTSGGQDGPLQPPRPPFASIWGPGQDPSRPTSRASKRALRPATSTSTFKVVNPDLSSPSTSSPRPSTHSRTPARQNYPAPATGNGSAIGLTPRLEPSRASLKSTKSYSKYNPNNYVDPAFWGEDGPGGPPAAAPAQPRPSMVMDDEMGRSASRLSRRTSVNSGLSYA